MTPGIAWEKLDEFTRLAVPLVLGRFPDWERYAVTTPEGYVRFTVPCPNPALSADSSLKLWTFDLGFLAAWFGGITCGRTVDPFDPALVAGCLDYAVDVLTDYVGTLNWYIHERAITSAEVTLPVAEWPVHPSPALPYDRVTLRTWSGDGDRDWPAGWLECPAGGGE